MGPSVSGESKARVKYFGFYTSLVSMICYLLFDIAAAAGMSGLISSPFVISLSWYAPSLLLAYSFLGMIIALHFDEISGVPLYSFCAIVLAVVYVTLNSFVYIIQVLIVAPSFITGNFADAAMFEVAEGKPFWAVNGLAYTIMGFSTLMASFSIRGTGLNRAIRILLLVHGIVAPAVLGAVMFKPFFILSSTVGLTYPIAATLVSIYMWRTRKEICRQ